MARQLGSLNLPVNIEVLASAPLDARTVVNSIADLTNAESFPYYYVGMPVAVKSEEKLYLLVGNDTTDINNWKPVGSGEGGTEIVVDEELSDSSTNPVQNKVIKAAIDAVSSGRYIKVEELPVSGEGKNVYLILNGEDTYDQYVWVDDDWAKIGSSNIDLSDYVTTNALETTLADYATKEDLEGIEGTIDTDNYYTKAEVDSALTDKANASTTYSKTEVDDLISAINPSEVNLENYYDKDEVDSALALKANLTDIPEIPEIPTDYYTQSEVDTKLSAKADADTVYTKTEVDNLIDALPTPAEPVDAYTKTETDDLLDTKADSTDVYTKDEVDTALGNKADVSTTYTKTEVDKLIEAIPSGSEVDLSDYYTSDEIDEMLDGNIKENDMPDTIRNLDDIFENIVLPTPSSTPIPNVGVVSHFDETNGQLTYNNTPVQMAETIDTDEEIASILSALNEGE